MPPILTAEDVVKRIAAECAFVDERGAVGIPLERAAACDSTAINFGCGDANRYASRRNHSPCYESRQRFSIICFANGNPLTDRPGTTLPKLLICA
jgi:hypothetical protein